MPPAAYGPDITALEVAPDIWCDVLAPAIVHLCQANGGDPASAAGRLLVYGAREIGVKDSYSYILMYQSQSERLRKLIDVIFYAVSNTDEGLDFLAHISAIDHAATDNPPQSTPSPSPVNPMGNQGPQFQAPPAPQAKGSAPMSSDDVQALVNSLVQTTISSVMASMPQMSSIHAASPANASIMAVARQLVPIVTSHGDDCCPFLYAMGASDILANRNAPRYRWAKDGKNAAEIRSCLNSMAHFLNFDNPQGAVFDYLRTEKIRLAPVEFNLINLGSAWAAAELGGCIRAKERGMYATLCVARMPDADPGRLEDYASGKLVSPSATSFGGTAKEFTKK